jgi:hypothetical protein
MQPLPLGELFGMYYQMYQSLLLLGLSKEEALERLADVMLGGFGGQ